jgi:hypothetical protein
MPRKPNYGLNKHRKEQDRKARKDAKMAERQHRREQGGSLHHVHFDQIEEAAAFVAALTRQLASPRMDVFSASTEVAIAAADGGADVYLSADALVATERAFGVKPSTQLVGERPIDSLLIPTGPAAEPLGRDEILQRISGL